MSPLQKETSIRRTKKEEAVMDFAYFGYVTTHNVVEITTTCNIKAG